MSILVTNGDFARAVGITPARGSERKSEGKIAKKDLWPASVVAAPGEQALADPAYPEEQCEIELVDCVAAKPEAREAGAY